jgi:hypothetical protein
MCKMRSNDPFGHPKHKLCQKERSGVKLAISNLIPDHKKSRIDPTPMRAGGVQHTVESS